MNRKKKIMWFLSGGSAFDSDFNNILIRGDALGYTRPNSNVLTAQNKLFTNEKEFIQSCNIFYVFANGEAGAENFKLLNWAENSNTFNADYPTAITHSIQGIKGNDTNQFISTNWNASINGGSKYTLDSACRGAWIFSTAASGTVIDGTITTASRNCMRNQSSATLHKINQGGGDLAGALSFSGTGYVAIDRSSSTVVSGYNDLVKTDTTANSVSLLNEEQTLLRAGSAFGGVGISVYFCSGSKTEAAHNSFRNSFATYLSEIGA